LSDDYRLIPTSVISSVTEVRLYSETVEKVKAGHEEVPIHLVSMDNAIDSCVQNPTHVEVNGDSKYVFVSHESTNASGDPLRVPVKVVEGTSARITSVYFAEGNSTADARTIWRRQK
jgi:hypothetical protein